MNKKLKELVAFGDKLLGEAPPLPFPQRRLRERDIERYLVAGVKQMKGEVRKVKWIGRRNAPDRVVMLYNPGRTIWVELKNPDTIKTFPANAHERAQAREHTRMRNVGQHVVVIGTYEQVDELLR